MSPGSFCVKNTQQGIGRQVPCAGRARRSLQRKVESRTGAGQDVPAGSAEAEPASGPVELLFAVGQEAEGEGRESGPSGSPAAPGSSRPQTVARALLTINAPGLSGMMAAISVMPASADWRSAESCSVPTASQPVRGRPDAGPRFGDGHRRQRQLDVVLPRPGQTVQHRRDRHGDVSVRRLRPGPWSAARGWSASTPPAAAAAARTRRRRAPGRTAWRRIAPSSIDLARVAKVRRSARSRGSVNRRGWVRTSDTISTLPAVPLWDGAGVTSRVEP